MIYLLCRNPFIERAGLKSSITLKNKNCPHFLSISKLVDAIKADGKIPDITSLMLATYIKHLIVHSYSRSVSFHVLGTVYNTVKFGKLIKTSSGFGYLNSFKVETFL